MCCSSERHQSVLVDLQVNLILYLFLKMGEVKVWQNIIISVLVCILFSDSSHIPDFWNITSESEVRYVLIIPLAFFARCLLMSCENSSHLLLGSIWLWRLFPLILFFGTLGKHKNVIMPHYSPLLSNPPTLKELRARNSFPCGGVGMFSGEKILVPIVIWFSLLQYPCHQTRSL